MYPMNEIFQDALDNPEKITEPAFINDADFIRYVRLAIYKKSPLKRSKLLSLIAYYGKKLSDLERINFLGEAEVIHAGEKILGNIVSKGDGKAGILGEGPIVYTFETIKKEKIA